MDIKGGLKWNAYVGRLISMASHPFHDDSRRYLVLVNALDQHSLWPADIPVPAGWHTAFGDDTRQACLDFVTANWTDIRPASPADVIKDFLEHGYSAPLPRQPRGDTA
jgi:MbtH protein